MSNLEQWALPVLSALCFWALMGGIRAAVGGFAVMALLVIVVRAAGDSP